MTLIELETLIQAPPARCYALKLDVQAHVDSTRQTGERIVAGRTAGCLTLGEIITWEARHFGLRQRLTVQVTAAEPPHFFRDEMLRGAFRTMSHCHYFEPLGGGAATRMRDAFAFESPAGVVGGLVDRYFLRAYLTRFLRARNQILKQQAEGQAERLSDSAKRHAADS